MCGFSDIDYLNLVCVDIILNRSKSVITRKEINLNIVVYLRMQKLEIILGEIVH